MKMFSLFLLIISAHCVAEPKVIAVSDRGFIVENTARLNAQPDEVWHALVNDVDNWWPKDHSWWGEQGKFSISAQAGGCFCEIAADRSAQHMQIVFVEPAKLLRMTGGLGPLQGMGVFGALDWQFDEYNGKTKITLTYRVQGYNPDGFAELAPVVAQVQHLQLQGLVKYVNND